MKLTIVYSPEGWVWEIITVDGQQITGISKDWSEVWGKINSLHLVIEEAA